MKERFSITSYLPETNILTTTTFDLEIAGASLSKEDIEWLNSRGRNWRHGILVDTFGNLARLTDSNKNTKGHFYTSIWSWPSTETASSSVELSQLAAFKTKYAIKLGVEIWFGQFLNNDNYQFYIVDQNYASQTSDSIPI